MFLKLHTATVDLLYQKMKITRLLVKIKVTATTCKIKVTVTKY